MLANPTFYFWFNVILGVIFSLCPLIYGFVVNQKVYAIGGFITSFAVVFFQGWLVSLMCAGFFCFVIRGEDKKRIDAQRARAVREKNARLSREKASHNEKYDSAWSGDLINRLNGEEKTDDELFSDGDE